MTAKSGKKKPVPSRTHGTAVESGDRGVVKSRKKISTKRCVARRKAAKKRVVTPRKAKTVKAITIKVRQHRKKLAVWEKQFNSSICQLQKEKLTEAQVEAMRRAARAKGARPLSTLFDFKVGQRVMVLLQVSGTTPLWAQSSIKAIRDCNANNSLVKPRPMEHGGSKKGQLLLIQMPPEMWARDLRQNGVVAVRDWQVIPVAFFGKKHSTFIECSSSQGQSVERALVPGKGGKLQTVKARARHRYEAYGYTRSK